MKDTFSIVTTLDPDSVVVTRRSMFSGINNSLLLPLSLWAFRAGIEAWNHGSLVQEAFPTLTPAQREFLQTGATPDEWNRSFSFGNED